MSMEAKSASWQIDMSAAFAAFLAGVKAQLIDTGHVNPRPIVLSYEISLSQAAKRLEAYLTATGLVVIPNPIDVDAPQAQIAALKQQLDVDPTTQVIVLSTPAYATLANQDDNQQLHHLLEDFGTGKKDALLPLMCEGGFKVASQIVPGHFLFRNYEPTLRAFDGPQGGMPAFLDLFGEVSGSSGLGLLPDLLDLESTNTQHKPIYATLFTVFSQIQARLTTDHVLEAHLDTQLATHPLCGHYDPAQGLHIADEEKQSDVSEQLSAFLADPKAKTALLLAPTLADAELSSLAVVEMLRHEHSHPRVIAIDMAQYPGRAAHQCLALTLRHTLKLASPIVQQLRQHTLGENPARPTVLVLKNYQHTGSYDNLYIKNNLANWPDLKVVVTCTGDYFNRHDPKVCFLSDPTSPDASSLQQINLAGFATQAAQATVMGLKHTPLENLEELLADSGLTPKRQAQQYELDRFLDRIAPVTNALPAHHRNAFISYAWEPNKKNLARQQRHLRQIVQDLGRVGFPTWLDIERMTGDINAQMAQNILSSHYVLLIGTPRYTQRATVLLNGQPTNVKREYDDILKGYQEGRLEVLPLSFLPKGPFDGEQSAHYPSFPDTLPQGLSQFDLSGIDDFDAYIHQLTDENSGILPQLLHLAERSFEAQQAYQTAKIALTDALALLPAQHLIIAQAEQDQRIYEVPQRRSLYIETRGKAENKGDSPDVGLTAQFDEFLSTAEDAKVEESKDDTVIPAQATTFVALGEGGSGKSLFSQIQYARLLEAWQKHKADPQHIPQPAWIPVYIPLKHYVGKGQVNTCVETALRDIYHLDEQDIASLKAGSGQAQKLGVLLILDGYDELGGETPHLYHVNQLDQWACPLKLLITSRVDYIPDPEKHKQYFGTQAHGFTRSYIQPFSAEDIQRYIKLYEAQVLIQQSQAQAARDAASGVLNAPVSQGDTYQTLAALPGLLELVKNPFLLNLVLQGLPYLLAARSAEDNRPVTRLAIYNSFSQYWFGKEVYRLVKHDDPELRLSFEQHAERLAFELYLNRQLSISPLREEDVPLWTTFLDGSTPTIAQARAALPLREAGKQQYEFMHKTLLEYFVTCHLVNAYHRALPDQPHPNPIALGQALAKRPPAHKVQTAAGVLLPAQDAGVFRFLKDVVEARAGEGSFKRALFEQVTRSTTPEGQAEPKTGGPFGLAAAHAATILTKTGTSMAKQAWSNVQLPGADLGLACLACADLNGANLQGSYLVGTFLYETNLQHANLVGVRFGEYPSITLDGTIRCLAYYPSKTAPENKSWIIVGMESVIGRENIVGMMADPESILCLQQTPFLHQIPEVYESLFTPSKRPAGVIVLLDLITRQTVWRGEGHTGAVECVAFHPAGNQLVSGSYDKTLRLWQMDAGGQWQNSAVLRGHESWVMACAFHPKGNQLVSGSRDKTLRVWQVDASGEWRTQAVLWGHEAEVLACAFNPIGNRLVSGSTDKTLRIWGVGANGAWQLQAILRGHGDKVGACAFHPTGNQLVSSSCDKTLRIWQASARDEWQTHAVLQGHTTTVNICAFNLAGDRLVSGGGDALQFWQVDASGKWQPQTVLYGQKNVSACAFHPAGDQLVSSGGRELRFWQVDASGDDQATVELQGHEQVVTACAFHPTGNQLVSGSFDGTLRLWSVNASGEWQMHTVLREHQNGIKTCAFHPAGNQLASGSCDKTLRIWQVNASGKWQTQTVLRDETWVGACAFHPAGNQLVSQGMTTCLWQANTNGQWQMQAVLERRDDIRVCIFNSTGDWLVLGSGGGALQLWQVDASGKWQLQKVLRHKRVEGVDTCAFNPADDLVVSGSRDKTLRVWDIHDAHHIACVYLVKWCAEVRSITLHTKDHLVQLVTGDDQGLLSSWEFAGEQLRFSGLPPQPGFAQVWRDSWRTVNLTNAQTTGPIKALLEQFRGEPLPVVEEVQENKDMQIIAPHADEVVEEKPDENEEASKSDTKEFSVHDFDSDNVDDEVDAADDSAQLNQMVLEQFPSEDSRQEAQQAQNVTAVPQPPIPWERGFFGSTTLPNSERPSTLELDSATAWESNPMQEPLLDANQAKSTEDGGDSNCCTRYCIIA